jgi:hypothetical protein
MENNSEGGVCVFCLKKWIRNKHASENFRYKGYEFPRYPDQVAKINSCPVLKYFCLSAKRGWLYFVPYMVYSCNGE